MNAGFSSLTALKAQLLAPTLRARTDWDTKIAALGLGVAGAFEGFCNRSLARVAAGTFTTTGGRASLILPRYPVETITALETRDTIAAGWTDALASLDTFAPESGAVYFASPLDVAQIRVTYTGGFWWDTSEDASGTLPGGATALPAEILSAWHMQVEKIWNAKDKLGTQIAKEPTSAGGTAALTSADLSPAVRQMLSAHVRYALT